MPIIGQAPSVVPFPELSESELQDRREALEEAAGLHREVLDKFALALRPVVEARRALEKLERTIASVPSNRAVHLSRRLGVGALRESIMKAEYAIRSSSAIRRIASRGLEEARQVIVDPGLLR